MPYERMDWCDAHCEHLYRMRTQPKYVRAQVFERDRGICALCGLDTEALRAEINAMFQRARSGERINWALLTSHAIPFNRVIYRKDADGIYTTLGLIWDADHIKAVAEGGGECDLDNYRTLCCKCHRKESAALSGRLAAAKRRNWRRRE